MKLLALIPVLASSLLAAVRALPDEPISRGNFAVDPIPGYTTVELSWAEVYAQILQINPEYQIQYDLVSKRDSTLCGNFGLADKGRIQEGITYLRGLNGAPRNGPGPANCGRVSCSYNAAIWWCNDNTTPKTLDGWNPIADGAQNIINDCAPAASQVSGQRFHDDLWNVIVRGDSC
ncbi:hypothetical protein GQ53DRAFT_778975 [Thozetella sp. PMI_491]|nr:hypothetical protein GQ53DRAFT_778975 [Thozetella sp. PMI_491]